MFEILLAGLVVFAVYLMEGESMRGVAGWIQEFLEYLERQQQRG
jgi:hypothetical protein